MQTLYAYFSKLPISSKLFHLLIGIALSVGLIASSAFMVSAYLISKQHFVPTNVNAVVKILSEDSVLMSLTGNITKAKQTLQAASEYTQLQALAIYNPDGTLHASYNKTPDHFSVPEQAPAQTFAENQYLASAESAPGQEYTLFIQADPALPPVFFTIMSVAGMIIVASFLLITLMTARYVRRFITKPVLHLIRITAKVSRQEDYRVRARVFHQDEIGTLSQAFNVMLSRIASRDQQLKEEKEYERQLLEQMQHNNQELEHEILVRQKAERKLKQFQEYLNNIINSMPSALVTVDNQLVIQQCNSEAARLASTTHEAPYEASHKTMIGQPMAEALPFLQSCLPDIKTTFDEQSIQRVEKLPVEIDGKSSYMDLIIYPLSGDDHAEAVIRIDDITQRLKLEEVMVQTEKMMTVGGLAAGMAHEINNPLGAVIQGAQNIRRRISVDLPANQHTAQQHHVDLQELNAYLEDRGINRFLDNIQDAGLRASTIIRNMLKFSRQDKPVLSPTNLEELLENTVELAASDLNWLSEFDFMRIRVDYDLDPELLEIPCIASELQQVLLNLLKNAAHAINQRNDKTELGRIRITTRREQQQAVITLADNGCGMTEEVRKRIFEPFYTTKDVGVGTGLGLSVSYFIITTHHKGTLSVTSTPEQGSEFILRLPLLNETVTSSDSKVFL